MTRTTFSTDQRPWVDAWNKERMLGALIDRIDRRKGVGDAGIDEIVKDVRPADAEAGTAFLKHITKPRRDLRYRAFDLRDAYRKAADAYRRIDDPQPKTAGVYGLDLAKTLEQWTSAHNVLAQAKTLSEQHQLEGSVNASEAEATIERLTPAMRAFAEAYDAMLRGEKAVSDVAPKATLFALFPELQGKHLPELHEELAKLIERADEGLLVGLFNHRWLESETVAEFRVEGPLLGDLNEFVALLRSDAERLRKGEVFGPSKGFARPGTDPIFNYLRSTEEKQDFGLIPGFLHQLALPAYARETFAFGDESRANLPTYGGQPPPPLTMRVERTSEGARITIG